jgi:hypothetical protein
MTSTLEPVDTAKLTRFASDIPLRRPISKKTHDAFKVQFIRQQRKEFGMS